MNRVTLLLVDDQVLFREGLRTLLSAEPGVEVVGEAGDGEVAVHLGRRLQPQVVLMDLRMPRTNGVEATRRLRSEAPSSRVIVLTTFDDDEDVFEALRAGAVGYLLKDAPRDKLLEAIRAAARGESFLQPSVAAKVVAEFSRLAPARPGPARPGIEGIVTSAHIGMGAVFPSAQRLSASKGSSRCCTRPAASAFECAQRLSASKGSSLVRETTPAL